MKKIRGYSLSLLVLCLASALMLTGCSEEKTVGSTISEPEITADYLTEDYTQQLLTDGAETMIGSVTIEKVDESYLVHITEKEVVPSDNYEEGYYIADTNVVKEVSLGFDARIVCDDEGEAVVSNADDFMEQYADASEELFTVYLMGESAELIMPVEPETMIEE